MDNPKLVNSSESVESKPDHFMIIILLLAIAGFIWFMASGQWKQTNEIRHVFDVQVQARGCVVASMKNQRPSTYRCDTPVAGQYVDADTLWAKAEATVAARYAKR